VYVALCRSLGIDGLRAPFDPTLGAVDRAAARLVGASVAGAHRSSFGLRLLGQVLTGRVAHNSSFLLCGSHPADLGVPAYVGDRTDADDDSDHDRRDDHYSGDLALLLP
jgi:hypothetical protein